MIPSPSISFWFCRPQMVASGGYLFGGYQSDIQTIYRYDLATGEISTGVVGHVPQYDDHDAPAVHVRPDGRILAMWAIHNDTTRKLFSRLSVAPYDVTAWGPVKEIDTGTTYITYPQVVSTPGQLYIAYRRVKSGESPYREWLIQPLTDDGDSLVGDAKRELLWKGSPDGAKRPYVIASSLGSRVDCFATDHSQYGLDLTHNRTVRHFYRSNGEYYDSHGANVSVDLGGSVKHGPFWRPGDPSASQHTHSDATLVYEAPQGSSCWITDASHESDGTPVALLTMTPDNNWLDHRLLLARWTGLAWDVSEVCALGRGPSPEPPAFPDRSPHYSGQACFDRQDASVIYASVLTGDKKEIVRFESEGGQWARAEDITTASSYDAFRPWADGGNCVWSGGGEYVHLRDYSTRIVISPAAPPEWQLSNADAPWGDPDYRIRNGLVEQKTSG